MKKYNSVLLPMGNLNDVFHYDLKHRVASFLLLAILCSYIILFVLRLTGIDFTTSRFIVSFITICPFSIMIRKYYAKINCKAFILFFVLFLFFIVSITLNPEYIEWYTNDLFGISSILLFTGPLYLIFIISFFDDLSKLFNVVVLGCNISFFTNIIFLMRNIMFGGFDESTYDMDFGYRMGYCACIYLCFFSYKKKMSCLFLSFFCFFCLLMFGSRGSVLPFLITIIIIQFIREDLFKLNIRNLFYLVTIFVLVVYFYIFPFAEIITNLSSFFYIKSRTIDMLLNGDIMVGNGRQTLSELSTYMIENGGLFGYGMFGDRYYIGNYFKWGYPHNIINEILIEFGYLGGSILILLLSYMVYRLTLSLINQRTPAMLKILILVNIACSAKLFVSDSFWYNINFWMLIALYFNLNKLCLKSDAV